MLCSFESGSLTFTFTTSKCVLVVNPIAKQLPVSIHALTWILKKEWQNKGFLSGVYHCIFHCVVFDWTFLLLLLLLMIAILVTESLWTYYIGECI